MSRVVKQSSAQIDTSRIIGSKKSFEFDDKTRDLFMGVKESIEKYQSMDPEQFRKELEMDNKAATLTRNQKKKLKQRNKKKLAKGGGSFTDKITEIASELMETIGVDKKDENTKKAPMMKIVDGKMVEVESKNEEKEKVVKTKLKSPEGYDYPEAIPCDGVIWPKGSVLPPVIKKHVKILKGIFGTIKDSDTTGCNVMYFPPAKKSVKKNNTVKTTMVSKASHGCIMRIVASFGSPEVIKFDVEQGKNTASCETNVLKDQAFSINFGVCSTCSLSFNDNTSYLYKINKNARGTRRNKNPYNRHILIIDFISSETAITRAFKNAAKDGSKGNAALQRQIEKKLDMNFSDSASEVAKKAALDKIKKKSVQQTEEVLTDGESELELATRNFKIKNPDWKFKDENVPNNEGKPLSLTSLDN